MTSPGTDDPTTYLAVAGDAVLIGKAPDGDSVRFRPRNPDLLGRLEHGDRLRTSADGTVQLRFDGIDAPELHYQGRAQPRGDTARDALLQHLGFDRVTYREDGATVRSARPRTVPLVILARMVEVNGRPVAIVFAGQAAADLAAADGTLVQVTPDLLGRSVNVWEAGAGVAYPLLYTSTAPPLRDVFVAAARDARERGEGVWAEDSSARFPVSAPEALGPGGALVLPKLFRRAVDYLRERTDPAQTLPEWLAAQGAAEDDQVLVGDAPVQLLHTLLHQDGDTVTFSPDPLDLVFVER